MKLILIGLTTLLLSAPAVYAQDQEETNACNNYGTQVNFQSSCQVNYQYCNQGTGAGAGAGTGGAGSNKAGAEATAGSGCTQNNPPNGTSQSSKPHEFGAYTIQAAS